MSTVQGHSDDQLEPDGTIFSGRQQSSEDLISRATTSASTKETTGSPRAFVDATSTSSHPTADNHISCAAGISPDLKGFELLRLWAEQFADAQKARISASNRFTAATKLGAPLDPTTVETIKKQAKMIEDSMALPMRRTFRKIAPEIYQWVKETPGLGEHTVARLLGCIGHPVIATPHHWEGDGEDRKLIDDEPYQRSVSQLWSYCGVGDPARKRRRGMTAEEAAAGGNPVAKMLVRLIAESCMKQDGKPNKNGKTRERSPYRDVYDLARARYEDREEWSDLHKHNAALRYVGKQFLKDLWVAAGQ